MRKKAVGRSNQSPQSPTKRKVLSSSSKNMINDKESESSKTEIKPLMTSSSSRSVPLGSPSGGVNSNEEFVQVVIKFVLCFLGLQASYLTWGYMQELIMTTKFTPTENVPSGLFPSAAFCVFSNRFLAVIVALISVRLRHGAFFANNKAPLAAFTPCALSNTMSSWSQYKALRYVSFPVQTVFKSSKGKIMIRNGQRNMYDDFSDTFLSICATSYSRHAHGKIFEGNYLHC